MEEGLLTEFRTEGQPAFPVENTEPVTPAESSSGEQTDVTQTQSSEGEQTQTAAKDENGAGFADHPRWKEREEDWKERFNKAEQRHIEELQKFREDVETKLSKVQPSEQRSVDIPSWFGGDETQWTEYQAYEQVRIEQAAASARAKIESEAQEKQKQIDAATSYFEDQVSKIETDKAINPDGAKVDRNKLLKFVSDNDLVDSQGRWNYKAGFQLLRLSGDRKTNDTLKERREIAAITSTDSRAESKPSNFMTQDDFENPGSRPW
jgi:hypothetical protein